MCSAAVQSLFSHIRIVVQLCLGMLNAHACAVVAVVEADGRDIGTSRPGHKEQWATRV